MAFSQALDMLMLLWLPVLGLSDPLALVHGRGAALPARRSLELSQVAAAPQTWDVGLGLGSRTSQVDTSGFGVEEICNAKILRFQIFVEGP